MGCKTGVKVPTPLCVYACSSMYVCLGMALATTKVCTGHFLELFKKINSYYSSILYSPYYFQGGRVECEKQSCPSLQGCFLIVSGQKDGCCEVCKGNIYIPVTFFYPFYSSHYPWNFILESNYTSTTTTFNDS